MENRPPRISTHSLEALVRLERNSTISEAVRDVIRQQITDLTLDSQTDPARIPSNNTAPLDFVSSMKSLVEKQSDWGTVKMMALPFVTAKSLTAKDLAYYIESASLLGSSEEIVEAFRLALNQSLTGEFYPLLHADLRTLILSQIGLDGSIAEIMMQTCSHLTNVEKLYAFLYLKECEPGSVAITDFVRKEWRDLSSAAKANPSFKVDVDMLAHLASGTSSWLRGQNLATDLSATPKATRLSRFQEYVEKLSKDPKPVLKHLYTEAFQVMFLLFKDDPSELQKATTALVALAASIPDLANLQDLIPSDIFTIQDKSRSRSFWSAWTKCDAQTNQLKIMQSIALIFDYVYAEVPSESKLWAGYHCLASLSNSVSKENLLWRKVVQQCLHTIRANEATNQKNAIRKSQALLAMSQYPQIDVAQLTNCLAAGCQFPADFFDAVLPLENSKATFELLRAINKNSPLSNACLKQFAKSALSNSYQDLTCRALSILAARGELEQLSAWETSGEKRSLFPHYHLQMDDVALTLQGEPEATRKVLQSILALSTRLADLINHNLDQKKNKSLLAHSDPSEKRIHLALLHLPFFSGTAFSPGDSRYESIHFTELKQLLNITVTNPWSFALNLTVRSIGYTQWSGSLSNLRGFIQSQQTAAPVSSKSTRSVDPFFNQWLRDLSPAERIAWADLNLNIAQVSDDEFAKSLAAASCCIALLCFPNSWQALATLRDANVSQELTSRLEQFVLEASFDKFREKHRINSQFSGTSLNF